MIRKNADTAPFSCGFSMKIGLSGDIHQHFCNAVVHIQIVFHRILNRRSSCETVGYDKNKEIPVRYLPYGDFCLGIIALSEDGRVE